MSDRKLNFFGTGSQKVDFWKAREKLFREFYSRFSISCQMTAPEVIEVLSVPMTSSPEVAETNFSITNSEVFEPTEFNSEHSFPIVYGPSLRSASVLTLVTRVRLLCILLLHADISDRLTSFSESSDGVNIWISSFWSILLLIWSLFSISLVTWWSSEFISLICIWTWPEYHQTKSTKANTKL